MRTPLREPTWWPVRNTASEAVPPYGVMRIISEETTSSGRFRYTVGKPNATFQRKGYLINGPFTIAAEGSGAGTFGAAYALCDDSDIPIREDWWGPKDDSWALWYARPGFYICGNAITDGEGESEIQRAMAEAFEITELWGTLDGALAQGSSATMSIYYLDGGAWTDSSLNVTVHDRLLRSGAADIQSGKWVKAEWYCDRWLVPAAECNTPA
jgi:hypothetical protein